MDLVKIVRSAFGAGATGFSVSAAIEAFDKNVFAPGKAGILAAVVAVVFAVKTAILQKIEETKAVVVEFDTDPFA